MSPLLRFSSFSLVVLLCFSSAARGQSVAVPNPSFEEGDLLPVGWRLSGGEGEWIEGAAAEGRRAVAVTGNGRNATYWRSGPLPLRPSTVYQVRFQARSLSAAGGTPISGPVFCNRDLGVVPEAWSEYTSIFAAPARIDSGRAWIRFGQWHVEGTVAFDAVELTPVQPVYLQKQGIALGEGERIEGDRYVFVAPFRSRSRNQSRPLWAHECDFNTDRWVFGRDSYVVYRHSIAGRLQTRAEVEVTISYYETGSLRIEASPDGRRWRELGRMAGEGTRLFSVPDEMMPLSEVWIRLIGAPESRTTGTESDPGSFQVGGYEYRAGLEGAPLDLRGATWFAAVARADSGLRVRILDLGDVRPGGRNEAALRIEIPPGPTFLRLPYDLPGAGDWSVEIGIEGEARFSARVGIYVPILHETGYGELVPGSNEEVGLWWASSGWKIGRDRPLPRSVGEGVRIRAARNEAEAAQLVVRPSRRLRRFAARAGDLRGPDGASILADRIDVLRVRYVPVKQPTDPTGEAGPWPDPLPPFSRPIDLAAGVNQPLWIRVRVPGEAAPGIYSGWIRLRAEGYEAEVPLQVEVYGFSLPRRPTCTTAFGFSFGEVVRYQRLRTEEEKREVLERYLEDFSRHRVSPYDPAPLDPFEVTWEGLTPHFDWTRWDSAMTRAIDRFGFNSFRLPIQGLGGGSFHARSEPELLGYAEGTPQYQQAFGSYVQQIERHLREKGWLDEAYVYWFDEPDPKDYGFVMNGFRKLREYAPALRRMLTEQVEPELAGGPDIWCPVSPAYDPERAASRKKLGETFWWYVCTTPKAPYAGLFIDHAGTELRVWLWQTWQYGLSGVLVWRTNYWTSRAAYPDRLQDPYEDPMSWVSGYGAGEGVRRPWGNGDGRFLYPPEAASDGAQERTVLEGPVDSIRWEMLRDGIEDYEYFVLLQKLLAERTDLAAERRAEYEKLLEVPPEVSESMTRFTADPAPIEAHRHALARAIESLYGK